MLRAQAPQLSPASTHRSRPIFERLVSATAPSGSPTWCRYCFRPALPASLQRFRCLPRNMRLLQFRAGGDKRGCEQPRCAWRRRRQAVDWRLHQQQRASPFRRGRLLAAACPALRPSVPMRSSSSVVSCVLFMFCLGAGAAVLPNREEGPARTTAPSPRRVAVRPFKMHKSCCTEPMPLPLNRPLRARTRGTAAAAAGEPRARAHPATAGANEGGQRGSGRGAVRSGAGQLRHSGAAVPRLCDNGCEGEAWVVIWRALEAGAAVEGATRAHSAHRGPSAHGHRPWPSPILPAAEYARLSRALMLYQLGRTSDALLQVGAGCQDRGAAAAPACAGCGASTRTPVAALRSGHLTLACSSLLYK